MSPFYLGFILGIFIGANLGLIIVSLCVMAKRGEGGSLGE